MNDMQGLMQQSEESVLHTYNRFPVVFDHGQGVHLVDVNGKEYLDFAAGIAVNALGYHYPGYDEALIGQIQKLTHVSNLYYTTPIIQAGRKVIEASGMDKVFFTNSGTEAIEGALKCARKYFFKTRQRAGGEIIAMENSFHGRSIGALSVTGNAHYREPFEPLMGGVRFARFNDLESVKALVNENTCAILLETIQGEGGIHPATPEFLQGVKDLCEKHDVMLILDEIQCGMGRTGRYFAWQHYGIQPDIMTCAKALGCGVPVGAFVLNERAAKATLEPGDHGSTYGGNPFVCAAASTVFDLFEKNEILSYVRELTPYLEKKLDDLAERFSCVKERRGMGFMQGLELEGKKVGEVVKACLEEGLLVISAGTNVVRIVPPLVISRKDIDTMAEILGRCLA